MGSSIFNGVTMGLRPTKDDKDTEWKNRWGRRFRLPTLQTRAQHLQRSVTVYNALFRHHPALRRRLLQFPRVTIHLFRLNRHQRLFHVLAVFQHVFQVQRRQFQAPRIGDRVAGVLAENQQ